MTERKIVFVSGREARLIPQGWQHPRDERGRYIPEIPTHDVAQDGLVIYCMAGVYGRQPDDAAEIAAYETVSEGTPISPAFPNTPQGRLDLLRYCAEHLTTFGDHKADAEAWAAILFGDAAIALDGTVVAQDR